MNQVEVRRKQIHAIICLAGVITWLMLGKTIGYSGIAYFAAAAECLAFLLCLLSECIPDALGKLLRGRSARGQYKNAKTIRRSVLIVQLLTGGLGGCLLFLLAEPLMEKVFRMSYGMLAVRILAPVIVLRVLTGVLLGYFQGKGTLMPTLAVGLLRQVFYLGFGCLFVGLLKGYGEKVQLLLKNDSMPSMYGAAGMAVAVVLTEVFVLLFVLFLYLASSRSKKKQEEGLKKTETFLSSVKSLYSTAGLQIFTMVLTFLPVCLGCILYQKNAEDSYASAGSYGAYLAGYLLTCSIPVLIIGSLLHGTAARAAAAVRKGEQKYARDVFGAAFHMNIVLGIFAALFLALMAKQTGNVLSVEDAYTELLISLLQKGSAVVLLAVLALLFTRVLQYTGKSGYVIGALGAYAIVFTAGAVICFKFLKCDVEGLVYAGIAALLVLCVITGFSVFRLLRVKTDLLYWIIVPCLGAVISGLAWYLMGRFMTPHLGYLMTIVLGLLVGNVLYWAVLLLLRSFRRQETEVLPGGVLLVKLKELMHIE